MKKKYSLPFGGLLFFLFTSFSLADCKEETLRRPAERHPAKETVRTPPAELKPQEINLNRNGARRENTEQEPFKTSSQAKNEAKWRVGITKDQKPIFVYKHLIYEAGKTTEVTQEFYEVDLGPGIGKVHVILMQHAAGEGHTRPHWEVGLPKADATGRLFMGSMGERAGIYEYHTANKIRIFFEE